MSAVTDSAAAFARAEVAAQRAGDAAAARLIADMAARLRADFPDLAIRPSQGAIEVRGSQVVERLRPGGIVR